MLDFFPVLLGVLLVGGGTFSHFPNRDYLSVETGKIWRGFFAIVIVLHHLALQGGNGYIWPLFAHTGWLAVAVFFFFSGYGLQKKYLTDQTYSCYFLRNRLPTILVPFLLATLFYVGLSLMGGAQYSISKVLLSFVNGRPLLPYSWHIINIVVFYCFFNFTQSFCSTLTCFRSTFFEYVI